jgi:tyrosyl-tRNA synthetase
MSIKDDLISKYFLLCTDIPESEIPKDENPRDQKMKLAYEITKIYHGEKKAKEAEENFVNTFTKGGVPEDLLEVQAREDAKLVEVLLSEKIVSSKTEFRRLISEGAITDMEKNEKIKDFESKVLKTVYKIGKHRFVKIK